MHDDQDEFHKSVVAVHKGTSDEQDEREHRDSAIIVEDMKRDELLRPSRSGCAASHDGPVFWGRSGKSSFHIQPKHHVLEQVSRFRFQMLCPTIKLLIIIYLTAGQWASNVQFGCKGRNGG